MTDTTDAVPGSLPREGIRVPEPGNLLAAPFARLLGDPGDLGTTRFGSSLGGYGGRPFRHLHASGCGTGEAQPAETAGYARGSVTRVPALSGISASH